jgi:hypothetical protein|nr:MAG TPA: hypothetical protein [Caudoviricetes sp.]
MGKATQHSKNFAKVKTFYRMGLWSEIRVRNAVTHPTGKPWITPEEYQEITGRPYDAANNKKQASEE